MSESFRVRPGPLLLAELGEDPSLRAHRRAVGPVPVVGLADLIGRTEAARIAGRGGAGFPFARKLAVAAQQRRRPVVVVNLAEGEPASHKDAALARYAPHRILDGAQVAAQALGCREIHVVAAAERPEVARAVAIAVRERQGESPRLGWQLREVTSGFVGGQARAVLEALAGRENLPVTAWRPEAESGLRGRATLLSNAETWAHVAAVARLGASAYGAWGTHDEPGTTLLTLVTLGPDALPVWRPEVVEVGYGTPWRHLLSPDQLAGPVLLGGYGGTWAPAGSLTERRLSRADLTTQGLTLGAGVVAAVAPGACPLTVTAALTAYLAGESAGRCGPCVNGLPELARAFARYVSLDAPPEADAGRRVAELAGLVRGRGACAHPDGAARLVTSALAACPQEVGRHALGSCEYDDPWIDPLLGAPWYDVSHAWAGQSWEDVR